MNLINEYNKITSPNDLLTFMSNNINYGYLSKSGKIYQPQDKNFDKNFFNEYLLENKDDILKTCYGNCFDQVELERNWFIKNNYEIETFFECVLLDYQNIYPMHTFLIFKDKDNSWNLFENANIDNRGIHKFSNFNELITSEHKYYINSLKSYNITEDELNKIIITKYQEPNRGLNVQDYLEHVIDSQIILKDNKWSFNK